VSGSPDSPEKRDANADARGTGFGPGRPPPNMSKQQPMSEPPPIRLHRRGVKNALKRGDLSDSFLAAKYRFSPYMACEHGCLYCDGRAERYYVEGRFDRDIVVRDNVAEQLAADLVKQRETGFIAVGSGVTDVYQPTEASEQLTRRCAQVLAEHDFPVVVLTKSRLILRDLDIWRRVNERSRFVLAVSLALTDDRLRRQFEPRASSVEERIETMRAFKAAGCAVGMLAMPLLPGIGDSQGQIDALYALATEIGVDWMMPAGTTLRPGRQKSVFLEAMRLLHPERLSDVEAIYADERDSGSPSAAHRHELHRRFRAAPDSEAIPPLVPHRLFKDRLLLYDEIWVLLQHMAELYEWRGVDTARLNRGSRRYLRWLQGRKRLYNRRRSMSYADLEEEVRQLLRSGEAERMIGNARLTGFLADVALARKTLDYATLELA
jgi:DNA repair photolyase